jgi:hypothetical protein
VSRRDLDDVWEYLMDRPLLLWYLAFVCTVTLVLTVADL